MTEFFVQYTPLIFVILMVVATIGLGLWATRRAQTASDFFVASRSVGVGMNASAIGGEYLSAASFMGVAGLVMKFGYDPLWYPACYAAGYLFLLLFIAGPLRRFGAYTIPDFAEGRFDSPTFRKIAVTFVLFIGFFYTMPQMKAAGITMSQIMGWPYWAGIVVVGTVITFNVALGGMKGITFVQAFQYWAKMFAISAPIFILMSVFGSYNQTMGQVASEPAGSAVFPDPTTVDVPGSARTPANILNFPRGQTNFVLPQGGELKLSGTELWRPEIDDGVLGRGLMNASRPGQEIADRAVFAPGDIALIRNAVPHETASGLRSDPLKVEFLEAAPASFAAGSPVPNAPSNDVWMSPFGAFTSKFGYPLLYTYSLIVALVCGTAGLPHILVRFYTNPDGRAAKRTTFWVMVLIGVFYMFTPVWGLLGRVVIPELYVSGLTDAVVIDLPKALENPLLGAILTGITSAGAFAAFMSTFSGLLVSMSGALAHDIYGRMLRPKSSPNERMVAFKVAAIVFGAVSMGLGYLVKEFDIAKMVGWAFAIGAASYFPLLLVGSWWRGLTKWGAATGMLVGGLLSLFAIIASMLIDKRVLTLPAALADAPELRGVILTLMDQPAIWGVPLSIILMFVVSKMTSRDIPTDVDVKMLRLHAPEEMGLSKNYIEH